LKWGRLPNSEKSRTTLAANRLALVSNIALTEQRIPRSALEFSIHKLSGSAAWAGGSSLLGLHLEDVL
jgi:hypothetical protein